MKVPFHLKRRADAASATALLLASESTADLLSLCVRLGCDPMPAIYPVPGGFLLKLQEAVTMSITGTIRLRALANNLFLPVDADLVPALLDDEARSLVRERGLVFLPGDRVLGFDANAPLDPAHLLSVERQPARNWQSFPDPPRLADRLESLTLDQPQETPDQILEAGGSDIGTEAPRPRGASLPGRMLGQAALAAGRGFLWLGNALHLQGLAGLGARLMAGAMSMAPRLSESILGKQEAALRELLRRFRTGDLENALRRALPLADPSERGGDAYRADRLPFHNLRYSLAGLLGGGQSPGSYWLGGHDVMAELMKEYRKAAEAATRAGDYRRAAFIYGMLLRNYRLAADTLNNGGLHHDAAILYLKKLGDRRAAARAFAASGEIDTAVALYIEAGERVQAADLLKSIGEYDAAITQYRVAADELVAKGKGYLAAGELMRDKAERSDLAHDYFAEGWAKRPFASAIACAFQLARIYADDDSPERLSALIAEADALFASPGNDHAATQFYNLLAELADNRKTLAGQRTALRDHALGGIARKLRERAAVDSRPGNTVSSFLARGNTWSPAVVSDAEFAFKAAIKPPRPVAPPSTASPMTWTRAGAGVVTAACFAPRNGTVFVGFQNGEVACFRPGENAVVTLPNISEPIPVQSLAVDAEGKCLVVVRAVNREWGGLLSFVKEGYSYRIVQSCRIESKGDLWLTPQVVRWSNETAVGLWNGEELFQLRTPLLVPTKSDAPKLADQVCAVLFLDPLRAPLLGELTTLWFDCDSVWSQASPNAHPHMARLGWRPEVPQGNSLCCPPLSWLQPEATRLELAGIGANGIAHWSTLEWRGEHLYCSASVAWAHGSCKAVTLVRAGLLAAISSSHIYWLRATAHGLTRLATTEIQSPSAIACFPWHEGNELMVICGDGMVGRLRVPC